MRIYVHAYWQQNLGDDLFVTLLCQRYPDILFYGACSRRSARVFERLPNFRRVPRFARIDGILRRARLAPVLGPAFERMYKSRCDAIVNIGGSIFMEREGWKHRMHVQRARFVSVKPTFVIGANFGPFSDHQYLDAMKALLRGAIDICVRDKASAKLLGELPNCRYAPDLVLSMDPGTTADHRTAVISLISLETRPNLREHADTYTAKMVEVGRACIVAGLHVVLMGFCRNEHDEAAVQRVREELDSGTGTVRSYIYDGDLPTALGLLSSASIIIGTRFHAIILAWVYGKKVLPISYSTKTEHVIHDLGFPGEWFRIEEIGDLDVALSLRRLLTGAPFEIGVLRAAAEQQFRSLDAFVAPNMGSRLA